MSTEQLTLNGVDVKTPALRTQLLSGLLATAPRRTRNVSIPGRHGELLVPRKRRGPLDFLLPLWVMGGTGGGDEQVEFYTEVDRLCRDVFAADTVLIAHTLPDGTVRELTVEVLDRIGIERWRQGALANVGIAVTAADPFWTDPADQNAQTTTTGGPDSWDLTEFAAATAPMDDLTVTFTATSGSVPNPILTNAGGVYVEYQVTLAESESVEIDVGAYTLTGGGGHVADYDALVHDGDPRWWVLDPGNPPSATVAHTGTGTLTVDVVGRRKYLAG